MIRIFDKCRGAWLGWQVGSAAAVHPVTGLPQRVVFEGRDRRRLEQRKKTGKVVLVLFDVNRLHFVNAALGLQGGDMVLRALAHVIWTRLRRADSIWQWGGDEILVLLDETDLTGGFEFTSRVEIAVDKLLRDPDSAGYQRFSRGIVELLLQTGEVQKVGLVQFVLPVTGLAAGIAEWPREEGTFEAALAQADAMLRAHKVLHQITR